MMSAPARADLDTLLAAVGSLAPQIAAARDQTELDRRVPSHIVDAMREAGLFRICLPKADGSMEVDFETYLRVVEKVSSVDGGTGWVLDIGAGMGMFGGYLPEQRLEEVFERDPNVVMAGALNPPGRAIPVPGGYVVNGRWPFASGSRHCSWVAGGCFVEDGAGPRLSPGGTPEPHLMFFPTADIEILDTWYSGGLRGSDSCDFAVKDVFVPERRVCLLYGPNARNPVYRVSVRTWFPACVAIVALGVARAAIDALVGLAETKVPARRSSPLRDQVLVQIHVAQAEAMLQAARLFFYDAVRDLWQTLTTTGELARSQNVRLQLACAHAADVAIQVVDSCTGRVAAPPSTVAPYWIVAFETSTPSVSTPWLMAWIITSLSLDKR